MKIKKSLLLSLAALGAPALAQTCQASAVTPYLNINGTTAWTQQSSASLNTGSTVVLGPQPFNGTWSWSGCGTSGASREQTIKLGMIPVTSPSLAQLKGFLPKEIARWGKLVQQAGIAGSE